MGFFYSLVMQTKLTLRLEDKLIKQAKEQGKSLSQIVADYFTVFTKQNKIKNKKLPQLHNH